MSAEERQKSCCSIESFEVEAGTDTYDDQGGESHKKIKFKFKVSSGADPTKCVMVNWVKGFAKDSNGDFFNSKQEGVLEEVNYPDWRVDTIDQDPVYFSDTTGRWRYQSEGSNTFSATDGPGPALSSEPGTHFAMKFKMCIYCIDDVPDHMAGDVIKSKAIKCIAWQFSVKVARDGSFTHPRL